MERDYLGLPKVPILELFGHGEGLDWRRIVMWWCQSWIFLPWSLSCLLESKGLKCPICFQSQWCCWQPDRPHCGSRAASDLQSKPHFTSFHLLSSMWSPGSTHNYFLLWKPECGLPTKYSSIAFWVARAKSLLYICPLQRVFWENESHMAFCSDDAGGLWWQVSREIWVR